MGELAKKEEKTYFSLKEGSNYRVLMTYNREEIVEFEQFKKFLQLLNDSEKKFLTINQRIINKNTIIDISPTDRKTEKEKEEIRKNPQEVVIDDGEGNPIKGSDILDKES